MVTTAEMCKAAIIALKERSGSSRQAIKKYILATYGKEPTTKLLSTALAKDIFVPNKGKFKLTPAAKKPPAKKKPKKKKAAPKKKAKKKTTKKKTTKKKTTKKKTTKKKPAKKKTTKKKPAKKKTTKKKK
jgi:histone H1/5